MISKIVMIDTDGDSSMVHPITKQKLQLSGGEYILSIEDYDKFIQHLYENDFEIEQDVHDTMIIGLEFDKELNSDFVHGESGNYCMGNYKITVIDEMYINVI